MFEITISMYMHCVGIALFSLCVKGGSAALKAHTQAHLLHTRNLHQSKKTISLFSYVSSASVVRKATLKLASLSLR